MVLREFETEKPFCITFILVHMNRAIFFNHDPLRTRKLLLHKKQINKLIGETKNTGITLVPLKVYIKDGYAKVLIGLAKGKKQYDKREDLKRKEVDRQISRTLKNNRR